MGMLYGVWEELPADLAEDVLHDDVPVGPANDPNTATAEPDDYGDEEPQP